MIIGAFFIALAASVIGGICGIGGGVLMKPVLDMTGIASVSTVSFLSGTAVLTMTGYNTIRNLRSQSGEIQLKTMLPLAAGSCFGGVIGKYLFELIKSALPFSEKIGAVQAIVLGLISAGTAAYTIYKTKVKTLCIKSGFGSFIIGAALGIISSFLGIGGGPINLLVLSYFFSMETKQAAQNSLFIILFSQLFSLGYSIISGSVPEFDPSVLLVMVAGGLIGGATGKRISLKLTNQLTDKLFIGLLTIIVAICIGNYFKYT